LILIGEKDDWTSAPACRRMVARTHERAGPPAHPLVFHVYPGAHHGFDGVLVPPRTFYGHTVGRHPEAAAQAET
jgi:dienelactone hydrolase